MGFRVLALFALLALSLQLCASEGPERHRDTALDFTDSDEDVEAFGAGLNLLQIRHPYVPRIAKLEPGEADHWQAVVEQGQASWTGPGAFKRRNLCSLLDDKILPEVYVLGAPKCATTTLATDLRSAGIASVSEPYKEFHFFDVEESLHGHLFNLSESQRSLWLEQLPSCSDAKARQILADYTPTALWMTRSEPFGKSDLPGVLWELYGQDNRRRVVFVVALREPLARYQSHWYYDKAIYEDLNAQDIAPGTFNAHVDNFTHLDNEALASTTFWAHSLYARHLKDWLLDFDARQFYVIPYHLIAGDKNLIFGDLSAELGVALVPSPEELEYVNDARVTNPTDHPALEDDVSPEVRAKIQKMIEPENQALEQLLANVSLNGGGLAGYSGGRGSLAEVHEWLTSNW